jgi:hypothetical protein
MLEQLTNLYQKSLKLVNQIHILDNSPKEKEVAQLHFTCAVNQPHMLVSFGDGGL